MPFTPFHFGPGALAKSVAPRWFSVRAFVLSQVVIDCETAWNIYWGNERLHTFFHSYLGVSVAMILTGGLLIAWNWFVSRFPSSWLMRELGDWGSVFSFRASLIAILFGGWSHVFLDSIMHSDMRPLAPFAEGNAVLDMVAIKALHMICLWSFVGAGAVWRMREVCRNLRRKFTC